MEGIKFQKSNLGNKLSEEKKIHKKKSLLGKIRNTIGPFLAAGALLTACDNSKNIQNNISDKPDRFDRTSEHIDQKIEEGRKALGIARRLGLEVKDGDSFGYQKEQGVIVSFTIRGKTISVDDLLNREELDKTNTLNKYKTSSSEVKINPEMRDFMK